jgi:thioredoxin reductase (NADPH)
MENEKIYDVAIIGTGPAGYAAAIYANRYKLSNIIFGMMPGGLITEAHKVCNYPGFIDVTGMELGMQFQKHAQSLGAVEQFKMVDIVRKIDNFKFEIETNDKQKFYAKTVILATGTKRRKLGIERERDLVGHGVSYCATCDANFFNGKIIAVVGGGDAANTASLLLAQHGSKVYQIYRGEKLRGQPAWTDLVVKDPKIEVIYGTNVIELIGEKSLEAVKLDKVYKDSDILKLDGLFVEIGSDPDNILDKELGVNLNEKGYIVVDNAQKTNLEGVWAAGDITTGSNEFRQVITACSEGSIAADSVYSYLKLNAKI